MICPYCHQAMICPYCQNIMGHETLDSSNTNIKLSSIYQCCHFRIGFNQQSQICYVGFDRSENRQNYQDTSGAVGDDGFLHIYDGNSRLDIKYLPWTPTSSNIAQEALDHLLRILKLKAFA